MRGQLKLLITLLCFFGLFSQVQAVAQITMPVTFSDGMVLQRGTPVRVFGEASDGKSVTVRFNGQEKTAAVDEGKWLLSLDAMPAGGPYELTISSVGETIRYTDVMVGEVWFAGGQSNMYFGLSACLDFEKDLPTQENPSLRFLHVPVTEFGAINRKGLEWKRFDAQSVRRFSAVAYYFATALQKRLGVTVGVIESCRGGIWNENWMTTASIAAIPSLQYLLNDYDTAYAKFQDEAAYESAYQAFLTAVKLWESNGGWSSGPRPMAPMGPKAYQRPAGLYQTMIKPLQPYTIKGCIWYQGEGNSARFEEYKTMFPALVAGWRKTWENPKMPFYFVQLPGYGSGVTWPQFRKVQLELSKSIPHAGMLVSEGAGDSKDLHPKVKKPIGNRLAIAVASEVYKQSHVPFGPRYESAEIINGKVLVRFEFIGAGLELRDTNSSSFEIAGEDKVFKQAQVTIHGDELYLWNSSLEAPIYTPYAYSHFPAMDLFNKEGLPASPFTAKIDGTEEALKQ